MQYKHRTITVRHCSLDGTILHEKVTEVSKESKLLIKKFLPQFVCVDKRWKEFLGSYFFVYLCGHSLDTQVGRRQTWGILVKSVMASQQIMPAALGTLLFALNTPFIILYIYNLLFKLLIFSFLVIYMHPLFNGNEALLIRKKLYFNVILRWKTGGV